MQEVGEVEAAKPTEDSECEPGPIIDRHTQRRRRRGQPSLDPDTFEGLTNELRVENPSGATWMAWSRKEGHVFLYKQGGSVTLHKPTSMVITRESSCSVTLPMQQLPNIQRLDADDATTLPEHVLSRPLDRTLGGYT